VLPKGTMDIRNHPKFVAFLNAMPRTEIALHGLHHINRGRSVSVEFQRQDRATCAAIQTEALQIFEESGLRYVRGLQPPGWTCTLALQQACRDVGIEWMSSTRDILTPVSKDAKTAMSGLNAVSICFRSELRPACCTSVGISKQRRCRSAPLTAWKPVGSCR
jgi:predicted deacetylase